MIRHQVHIFLILLILLPGLTGAQESSVVSAMLEEAGGDLFILDDIIAEHTTLLNKYPKSEFAPTLMFQLAELHYERSQIAYQQEMSRFETAMAAYQEGDLPTEPRQPVLDMEPTITYCKTLLDSFPKIKFRDKVIYKLAIALLDEGNQEEAKRFFSQLTEEQPDSPMALEAHFRIGEYFFEKRDFNQAIAHYRVLLNHWDNPFFDMALYKLGWSYYNQQKYDDAISSFLALIEDVNLVDSLKTGRMTSATDLRTESIHYIASSFSESGGPPLAEEFLQTMKEKKYVGPILQKLAELYENRNDYANAIASYRVLLKFYPFHAQATTFFNRIVENYEAAGDEQAAISVREEIIAYFRPGSEWQQHYPEGELGRAGLDAAKKNLVYLGTAFQAVAQAADSTEAYHQAIEKYRDYIRTFPGEDNTSEIHYYLAECLYNIGDYENSAQAYQSVVTDYPKSEWREKAAFNRIFSYVQMWDTADTTVIDTLTLNTFILTGDSVALPVNNKAAGKIIVAINDFCLAFENSEWIDQVYMKLGEVLNHQKSWLFAATAYRRVYDQIPESRYKAAAAINVGQCLFDGGYFVEADKWFTRISGTYADSTTVSRKAGSMAAYSRFKRAEQLSAAGKTLEAAQILLTIADGAYKSEFKERALFEAASQYQQADSLLQAARTFERLAITYPGSELGDKALYQAGLMRESLQDWQMAAHNYLSIGTQYPQSPLARQALKNAAQCYVNAEKWIAAKVSFLRYAETYVDNPDEIIEFTCQAGDMAYNAQQMQEAENLYQTVISTYRQFLAQGKNVDAYFAAQAQFMIGEIHFEKYTAIDLTPPLQTNLQRKVAEFNIVAQAYTEAIKFQIADWTTAASYRIGACFEEFVRAFLESPVPEDLDAEQKELYKEKLAQRARGYKQKALETYQKNIEQAEANGIDNSWVAESRKRAQILSAQLREETASISGASGS